MKRVVSRVLGTAALVVLATLVAACGTGAGPSATSTPPPPGKAEAPGESKSLLTAFGGSGAPTVAPTVAGAGAKPAATQPPAPTKAGAAQSRLQPATLSQADLNGTWTGTMIVIGAIIPADASPEEKAECEKQLAEAKAKPNPMEILFDAKAADSGTLAFTVKREGQKDQPGDPVPYRYQNGMIVVDLSDKGASMRMDGRTGKIDGKSAIDGTWSYKTVQPRDKKDPSKGTITIEANGTWTATK